MGITAASELCCLDRNMPRRAVRTPIRLVCLTGPNSSTNLIWSFTDIYHPHAMDRLGCSLRLPCLKWTHYKEFFRQRFFFSHQEKLIFFFCIEADVWIFQRRIMWKWLWSCSAWLNCLAMFWISAICFNALCAHSVHSSLECKQRRWPLRH